MAKTVLNLPAAFNWWANVIENQDVPVIQQLAMFHIINRLNKNFWSPAQISVGKLAAAMNADKRSVKAAVDALIAQNYVLLTEEGLNVNVNGKSLKIESDATYNAVGNVADDSPVPENVRKIFG